jgi:ADP-ribose pyrophosphatase
VESPKLRIDSKEQVFHQAIFRIFSVKFRYTLPDGTVFGPVDRLVLDRKESVGVILHDIRAEEIILVEQVRIATIDNGSGWLMEIPAGIIDDGETPEQSARRETKEETGAEPIEVEFVSSFYLSPGTSSERMHLFYCPFRNGLTVLARAGLAEEMEDIKVHRVPKNRALDMVRTGEIADAKTILALFYLSTKN